MATADAYSRTRWIARLKQWQPWRRVERHTSNRATPGCGQRAIDETVQKLGGTTGFTKGRVTSVDTDVTVQYETGNFTFGGQIIVVGLSGQPFSDSGDSGSLIVDSNSNMAIGLLFAGSTSHTIANHINDVLQALNVTLALEV